MEALLSMSQNAVDHWQLHARAMQAADAPAAAHGIHESQAAAAAAAHHHHHRQQQHHIFSVDQLSRLTSNGGAVDHQLQQQQYDHMQGTSTVSSAAAAADSSCRDGPKLEDFLGGKSLGGQYSDRDHHHHHHHHQLEGLYYNAPHGAASFQDQGQTRINVNLPYTHSAAAAGGSTGGSLGIDMAAAAVVPASSTFHLAAAAYGSAVAAAAQQEQSSLALNHLNHCYEVQEQQQQLQDQSNNFLAQSRSHLHAQNLLQRALDRQQQQQQSDCSSSLQPRQQQLSCSSSSGQLKSWLRQQADTDSKVAGGGLSAALPSWQPLSLSMSAGDHQGMEAAHLLLPSPPHGRCNVAIAVQTPPAQAPVSEPSRKRGAGRMGAAAAAAGKDGPSPRKSIDTFGQRTSVYRGVTRHRWTGRYEAHLWDNSCRKEGQTRKGRQVYLGGYDKEDKAARAYDLAALKYWGPSTTINFPLSTYEAELDVMKNMTRQEYVASLRRKSSGFSRGASAYRGVTRHHQHGRWQARIGRVAGNKDLYLGTYSTQEEAAEAYDMAAIKFRGVNAVTNFDMSRYDPQKIHAAAAMNGQQQQQHGQEISFKCDKPAAAADQKLIIMTELSSNLCNSDAVNLRVQDENHSTRMLSSSSLPAAGSRLELMSIVDQDDQLVLANQQQLAPCTTTGLPKNLLQWQMLYQQQAAAQQHKHESINDWGHATTGQDNCCSPHEMHGGSHGSNCAHLGYGSNTMHALPQAIQAPSKYNTGTGTVPSNGMLLRNLMGLEALPQEHGGGGGESSCSAGSLGLMNHHHGLPSSAASLLSSSQAGYQGRADQPSMRLAAAYELHVGTATSDQQQQLQTSDTRAISNSGLTYNQGSHDRSDVNMESPKNSVGESEEASSKNSTFDRVLPGDLSRNLLFSSAATTAASTVKLNPSYNANSMSTWIGISNPLTMPTLSGRPANLGHMGSGPIFAHSWTE